MDLILIQTLNGLASASSLFLVASGLSIIFGVTRVVNFAHGSFYMLGAYIAWSLVTRLGPASALGFWGGVVLAALLVGVIGVVIEVVLLRRIYQAPELFQLLATFGVVLMVQDVALAAWGPQDLLGPRAPGFRSFVPILGNRFPTYELFLIVLGPIVLGALWLLFNRTRWGTLVRAATLDREMVGALGVNQRLLFTSVFFLGSCLAGLGGALQLPREAVNLHMDLSIIAEAFVVVVVGGLGSVTGAFLAAVLIGVVHAFGILIFPKITLVLVFLIMAVVLIVRPYGLLGRKPGVVQAGAAAREPLLSPAGRDTRIAGAVALTALVLAPLVLGSYGISLLTELVILTLFAASLHFIMGPGGLASFGHAAYFGLGAYGAALAAKWLAAPMAAGLAGGALPCRTCGRGVRLVLRAAVGRVSRHADAGLRADRLVGGLPVGGADRRRQRHPRRVAVGLGGREGHLLLPGAGAVRRRRAGRCAPSSSRPSATRCGPGATARVRAEAIGLDVTRINWAAFAIAAVAAGIAGGLFAYFKGSVFPTYMAIPKSVDALLMVLLGGVQTVSGPDRRRLRVRLAAGLAGARHGRVLALHAGRGHRAAGAGLPAGPGRRLPQVARAKRRG